MNILESILYPLPPSPFVNVMSAVSIISLANAGISEVRGMNAAYSKFWNWKEAASGKRSGGTRAKMSGRTGMLLLYTPALAAAMASFFIPCVMTVPRGMLVSAALGVHFLKRVLEVRDNFFPCSGTIY